MKTLEEIKNEVAIEQSFEDNYFNTWDKFQNCFLGRYDNELDASVAYQNELNKL